MICRRMGNIAWERDSDERDSLIRAEGEFVVFIFEEESSRYWKMRFGKSAWNNEKRFLGNSDCCKCLEQNTRCFSANVGED